MHELASEMLKAKDLDTICSAIATSEGSRVVEPFLARTHVCEFCGGREYFTPCLDPVKSEKVWLCANGFCLTYSKKIDLQATTTPPHVRRALEWPLFCEYNDIGDLYHNVSFHTITQKRELFEKIIEIAKRPTGIIVFQGNAGSGKTFAALGICELFTRKDNSCLFLTHRKMFTDWLEGTKLEYNKFIEKVKNVKLLVIDDFGTSEGSQTFMSFFLDLINYRMQWKEKATLITTNLKPQELSVYCKEALTDRIKTGKWLEFKEKSRR